jgi:hypothetical protein
MRIRTLLAALAFLPAGFALPAAADSPVDRMPAAEATSAAACLSNAKGDRLAQIDCCKGHKGICGCRAGKIVCCDNTVSTEAGCTCHGDEAVAN